MGKATVNNVGLFLQDEWTLGSRLTLHAGLRTENEHIPSLAEDPNIPPTAIHFGFADKIAPRVGLAWDATGDRKTKVYGSWGVFYDITKLQITPGIRRDRAEVVLVHPRQPRLPAPSWTTPRVRPSVRARSSLATARRTSRPTIRTFTRSTRRWARRGCRNSSWAL